MDKWIQLQNNDGTDNLYPVEKIDLLWQNSSPTSNFSAQTVSINLSGYDRLLLVFVMMKSGDDSYCQGFIVDKSHTKWTCGGLYQNTYVSRLVDVSDSGVTFGSGYASSTSNQSAVIPNEIYGIKLKTHDLR